MAIAVKLAFEGPTSAAREIAVVPTYPATVAKGNVIIYGDLTAVATETIPATFPASESLPFQPTLVPADFGPNIYIAPVAAEVGIGDLAAGNPVYVDSSAAGYSPTLVRDSAAWVAAGSPLCLTNDSSGLLFGYALDAISLTGAGGGADAFAMIRVVHSKPGTPLPTSTLVDGSVTTSKIATGAVTTPKIADAAVTGGAAGAGVKVAANTLTGDNAALAATATAASGTVSMGLLTCHKLTVPATATTSTYNLTTKEEIIDIIFVKNGTIGAGGDTVQVFKSDGTTAITEAMTVGGINANAVVRPATLVISAKTVTTSIKVTTVVGGSNTGGTMYVTTLQSA